MYAISARLCVENDISVHIVKPPLPDNVIFTDSYQAGFYDYYDRLQEEVPQVIRRRMT